MENENENVQDQTPEEEPKIESLEDLTAIAENWGKDAESTEDPVGQPVEGEPVVEESDFQPTYTYTVKDEEREFDERLRNVIKDKETEEYVRDLYTKADGLETYKEKFSKRDSEYGELYTRAEALTGGYHKLQTARDKKDFAGLQKALGLDDDFIVQWGLSRVEEAEMPEEQRQAMIKQKSMEEELAQYKAQAGQHEEYIANQRVQDDIQELRTLVASEEVKPIAVAMTERGHDFIDLVVAQGNLEFQKTGVEPSIKDVVGRIAKQYSYLAQKAEPVQPVADPVQQQQTIQQPTIPHIGGNNQATVDKPITSMADLKKLADSL